MAQGHEPTFDESLTVDSPTASTTALRRAVLGDELADRGYEVSRHFHDCHRWILKRRLILGHRLDVRLMLIVVQ